MAWTKFTFGKYISDLVIGHLPFHFSVDNANITPPANGAALPLGTVVVRAKGLGVAEPWAPVSAAGDLVTTNEFAVVYGDQLKCEWDFVPRAIVEGRFNSVVIKRDAQFKEHYIKQVHGTALGATGLDLLKQLMADQGLLVLDDDTGYKSPYSA